MTLPTLIFGFLLSTLYGAVFHLWRGGNTGRMILYLALGWAGFWIGHFAGDQLGWTFGRLGALNVGFATLLSAFFLIAGHWLSRIEIEKK